MKIICNSIGFTKETDVNSNGRRLVTQGLDIKTMRDL